MALDKAKEIDRSHNATSSSNSPSVLSVTVAAVGGRLFFLTCLVNLLKPLPNCRGALMLSVHAATLN